MLDELSQELLHVSVSMLSGVSSEGFVHAELCLNVLVVEGHQLEGEELSHVPSDQFVLVKLAGVQRLCNVKEINLFIGVGSYHKVNDEVLECHTLLATIGVKVEVWV